MSRFLLPFALCLILAVMTASGQTPATTLPHHSLSLRAETVSEGGGTHASNKFTNSEFDRKTGDEYSAMTTDKREIHKHESVQIHVRNFGAASETAHVEWRFVGAAANPLADPHNAHPKDFVFDEGSKDVTIPPGGTETFTVGSKTLTAKVERSSTTLTAMDFDCSEYIPGTLNTQSGSTPRGWLVRITADGKMIDARGSSQTYEDIAKDDAKLSALESNPRPGGHAKKSGKH